VAGEDDVEAALNAAEARAVTWRRTPAHERMRILWRAAETADAARGIVDVLAGCRPAAVANPG
jgi:acyl-CoA reductase-like NAD-dependent aldehyde dehydrogenase